MSRKLAKNGFVIGAILLAFGLYRTYNTHQRSAQAQASQSWPSVIGKVTSAEVKTKAAIKRTAVSRGRRRVSYPAIEYAYTVNNQPYTNRRISFLGSHKGKDAAEATVARYAPGTEVDVYYDPGNPALSVLERDESSVRATAYIFPGGIMAVAGATLLTVLTIRKS